MLPSVVLRLVGLTMPFIFHLNDAPDLAPKVLNLRYKLCKGFDVLDIVHHICPFKAFDISLLEDLRVYEVDC